MFPATTYIKRRQALMQRVGSGLILLPGNEESSVNFKDNWYHFRQDSTFLYYFGISLPGLAAILDCDSGEVIVCGDELSVDDIIWTGPQPSIAELAEKAGVTRTVSLRQLADRLKNELAKGRTIHFLPPYRPENALKLTGWLGISLQETKEKSSVDLIKAIVSQRSCKTAEEIVEIEKAVNTTGEMHLAAMRMAREGMVEAEIAGKLMEIAVAAGGHVSFPPIVTKNGQVLHNHYYGNTLKEGDMVLCDAGAETAMGYAGDMTRTFPVSKTFSLRQKEIYSIVLAAHEAAVAALKPGVLFKDIHLLAAKKLVEGLTEVGLMEGDPEEAVAAGAHTMFFQCGLGHMMGLDVHDMEDLGEEYVGYTETLKKSKEFGLKSLRLARALEPGFVLTVEPGIYIIPELIDLWKPEKKYSEFINYELLESYRDWGGIRVEEDFLIVENGYRLLGMPISKSIEEVESEI